jgi:hypothetical protein
MKSRALRFSKASGSTKQLVNYIIKHGRHPARRRQHSKKGFM